MTKEPEEADVSTANDAEASAPDATEVESAQAETASQVGAEAGSSALAVPETGEVTGA